MAVIFTAVVGISLDANALKLKVVSNDRIVKPENSLIVDVVADDPTAISGAVLSISFPSDVLTLDQPAVSTDFFVNGQWQINTGREGVVLFTGLVFNAFAQTSVKQQRPKDTTLFSVHFLAKSTAKKGIYRITLKESDLCNGPAGWGTDTNNNGIYDPGDKYEQSPVLYTVAYQGDPNADILITDVLLKSFKQDPLLAFVVLKSNKGKISLSTSISPADIASTTSEDNTQNQDTGVSGPVLVLKNPPENQYGVSLTPNLEISYTPQTQTSGAQKNFIWQVSRDNAFDGLVFATTRSKDSLTLQLPELVLDSQTTYYWRVNNLSGTTPDATWSSSDMFTTGTADVVDLDGNGIPDDQDVGSGTNKILQNFRGINVAGLKVLKSDTGSLQFGLAPGQSGADVVQARWLDASDLTIPDESQAVYSSGLLAFKLNTQTPGATTTITVYYSSRMNSRNSWRGYDAQSGAYNTADYATISRDRRSVVLKLTDGGAGDADGVANGVIVTIGGPAGN